MKRDGTADGPAPAFRSLLRQRLMESLSGSGQTDREILDLLNEETLDELVERAEKSGIRLFVYHGDEVAKGEFPECVAVGSASEWGASGLLISPNVVLTATHSFNLGFYSRVWVGETVGCEGHSVKVADWQPLGRCNMTRCRRDVTVLVLSKELDDLELPPLASARLHQEAERALVVGFGATNADGTAGTGKKRQGEVRPARGKVRRHNYTLVDFDPEEELVCRSLTVEVPQDACAEDSGGPLYLWGSGRWRLAGITGQNAGLSKTACGGGAIYSRLDAHLDAIDAAIADLKGAPRQTR